MTKIRWLAEELSAPVVTPEVMAAASGSVTPEMIAQGVDVLESNYLDLMAGEQFPLIVRSVFEAMAAAPPKPPCAKPENA